MLAVYESDLVGKARAGDREAFATLYQTYKDQLYRFCLAKGGKAEDAEDITSETFLKALRTIEQYDDRGHPFSAFLYQVARNTTVDKARRKQELPGFDEHMEFAIDDLTQTEAMATNTRELLFAKIQELPKLQAQVLIARFVDGLSTEEIAQKLNRPSGAIRSLQHRGLEKLRVLVADLF